LRPAKRPRAPLTPSPRGTRATCAPEASSSRSPETTCPSCARSSPWSPPPGGVLDAFHVRFPVARGQRAVLAHVALLAALPEGLVAEQHARAALEVRPELILEEELVHEG